MPALEGIRVLDLTQMAPGAFCTMILGDLGADVIKIESPTEGRGLKTRGSPKQDDAIEKKREAAYDPLRRNKKSIVLNLKSPEGLQIFYRLSKKADVILEGFRPGVAERLKIDYQTISQLNRRIIYCSLSGYGQEGPYRNLPGHDVNYLSIGGVLDLLGYPEEAPAIPLNIVADFAGASLYGALAIMAALLAKSKTKKGQYIDISFTDGAISLVPFFSQHYLFTGEVPKRGETALHGAYPYYGVYQTKDKKYISIGCLEPFFWENLCRALGKEEYIPYCYTPEHYFVGPKDVKWQEVRSWLKDTFLTKTRDEWFDFLTKYDVPATKINTLEEAFSDPQIVQRKVVVEIEDAALGKIKQVGSPLKLSETPITIRNLSPFLGQHTREILLELGYSEEQVKGFYRQGAVA